MARVSSLTANSASMASLVAAKEKAWSTTKCSLDRGIGEPGNLALACWISIAETTAITWNSRGLRVRLILRKAMFAMPPLRETAYSKLWRRASDRNSTASTKFVLPELLGPVRTVKGLGESSTSYSDR